MSLSYRLPEPYVGQHRVTLDEIDEYEHVNNACYLRWLDRVAWEHSKALGISLTDCLRLRRGMAVRHTRLDYLQAALLNDHLMIATWIVASDGRLRCSRRFEVVHAVSGIRMLEAEIDFFCLNLDTGKPARFPSEFSQAYAPDSRVLTAYEQLDIALRQIGQWRR